MKTLTTIFPLSAKRIEFNDLRSMEEALAHGDVAAILMEPAMTNVGIVLPEEGYLHRVGELAKQYGALWIIDETHTISVGAGGMTAALGLKPDFLTIGKAIAGGIPTGTFGMTREVAAAISTRIALDYIDTGGIGGTLAGNALSLAAMRATRGVVSTATDAEILEAKRIIDRAGVGCEPASAASVAGVRRLVAEGVIGPDEDVAAILTGNILKDPEILLQNQQTDIREVDPTLASIEAALTAHRA